MAESQESYGILLREHQSNLVGHDFRKKGKEVHEIEVKSVALGLAELVWSKSSHSIAVRGAGGVVPR